MSYSSPTVATLIDVPQILCVNESNVSSHEPRTGKQLWSFDWPGSSTSTANCSQVVPIRPNLFFVSKSYGGGASLVKLAHKNGEWTTDELWHEKAVLKTKFTNVVQYGPSLFALSDGILECVDLPTGRREWKKGYYGQGQILGVRDLLLVQAESGEVVMCKADADRPVVLTRLDAIEGDTWNNPCLHGRLLLVRNAAQAACYELPVEE